MSAKGVLDQYVKIVQIKKDIFLLLRKIKNHNTECVMHAGLI